MSVMYNLAHVDTTYSEIQSLSYNTYAQKNSSCQHSSIHGLDSTAPDHHSNTVV